MTEERTTSTLKGRLADVFVPALVAGEVEALSRRLGNRAIVDDPVFGRASTLSTIDPLLEKTAARFKAAGGTYRPVATTTGVDRDVAEGLLTFTSGDQTRDLPIAVVAERRRLREIELRLYYAAERGPDSARRAPIAETATGFSIPQVVLHVLEAMKKGAIERVLAGFEETARIVDPYGYAHGKRDNRMSAFLGRLGAFEVALAGTADDGRTCSIEGILVRQGQESSPTALSFERGDSGLLRELRLYYEP